MPKLFIQDPTLPQGFSNTFRKRFWAKVNKDGPIPEERAELGACWMWTACKISNGYGTMWCGTEQSGYIYAHRASWIIEHGDIPKELDCLHHCDNPSCVRPIHLFIGTAKDNVRDCINKGRFKHGTLRGEQCWASKLSAADVVDMRSRYVFGNGVKLAREYGISNATFHSMIHKYTWKHV